MQKILAVGILILITHSCKNLNNDTKNVKSYYPNGKLFKEFEVNLKGQRHGIYKEFDEEGILKIQCSFLNDKKNGKQIEYYPKNKIKVIGFYKNSILDSLTKYYYQNGTIKAEFFRLNGQLFGIQKNFYETGKIKEAYFMINDTTQIFSYDFEENGKIKTRSKSFCYCIYNKDILSINDTAKLVFYTYLPPNIKYVAKIIQREVSTNKYYSTSIRLDTINNNNGYLFSKSFDQIGKYRIGFTLQLYNKDSKVYLSDSLFLDVRVQ